MFNFLNNFFFSAEQHNVESSNQSDDGNHQKEREQKKKEEKKYLEREEADEVRIGGRPELTEDEIMAMTIDYINKLKSANADREKVVAKLDKFLENFDIKRFIKNNPHMTHPDFYMVIFNETDSIVN
ncbi:MAG: hypothetical protein K6E29_06740 [Cyanobacteria bacterium RUI128]|nr:hypothetical protein [Cyanobacteria bacterium RUI128]